MPLLSLSVSSALASLAIANGWLSIVGSQCLAGKASVLYAGKIPATTFSQPQVYEVGRCQSSTLCKSAACNKSIGSDCLRQPAMQALDANSN